jgi:hypothetical protein
MSEERTGAELPEDDDLAMLEDLLEPESDELEPDEGEDLPEEEAEDEPPPEPRRRPSARQRAVLRLRDRQSKLEEENRNLRQVMERLSQTQPPLAPQPDPYRQQEIEQREAERVAQMMPHEQAQYYARKAKDEMSGELMRARIEVADYLDRQSFDQLKQQEPMAERLSAKIEEALAHSRRNGMNPTRVALYNQIFAEEVRAKAKRQADTQRKRGRAQIAAQTTRPGTARSTAAPTRRRQDNEDAGLDDRLRKVTVGDVW